MKTSATQNHQDYVTFTPKAVKLFSSDEWKVLTEHIKIVSALRENQMTAKDMHQIFYSEDDDRYKYTLKTIYRHIEKLEKSGIIALAGHRVIDGSKTPERVYSRTAKVFFVKPAENASEAWDKNKHEYASGLAIAISEGLGIPSGDINKEEFVNLFKELSLTEHQTLTDLMEKAESNEELNKLYSNVSIEKLNDMNRYASLLLVLINNPWILEKLRKILKL